MIKGGRWAATIFSQLSPIPSTLTPHSPPPSHSTFATSPLTLRLTTPFLRTTLLDVRTMAPTSSVELDYDMIEDEQVHYLLHRRIDGGRYLLEKRLGSGGYSVVYLATDFSPPPDSDGKTEPVKVAVKCLLNRTPSQQRKCTREFQRHRRASTFVDGIISLHRKVEEDDLMFIILDYCEEGDLFRALTETKLFHGSDDLIKGAFLQLFDSVADLHGLGLFHRDLKPENILLSFTSSGLELLISDFGMATESDRTSDFGCGSYYYMSPECVTGFLHNGISTYSSRAADIWALGIILVNIIFSRLPWKSATPSDPAFQRYMKDPRFLIDTLPFSEQAFQFLNHIFSTHGHTKPLARLREDFLKIDTFYKTREELMAAPKSARLVALEWYDQVSIEDISDNDIENMTDMDKVTERDLFIEDTEKSTDHALTTTSSLSSFASDGGWATAPTHPSLSGYSVSLSLSPVIMPSDTLALSRLEAQPGDLDDIPEINISIETSPSSTLYADSDEGTRAVSPSSSSNFGMGELSDSDSLGSSGSASPFPITPETHPVAADTEVADLSGDALGGSVGQWTRSAANQASTKIKHEGGMNLAQLDEALAAVEGITALTLTTVE